MSHNAKVITISNFKGGTGKTTGTTGLAYVLARAGHKVLVIDFDPQANATWYLMPDYDANEDEMTFYDAIEEQDLLPVVKKAHRDHPLFLIPATLDLTGFPELVFRRYRSDVEARNRMLATLIEPLREKFDYIFIDIPPTISFATNNAFVASDYIIISLQTQRPSYRAMHNLIPEIRRLSETLDLDLQVLGIMAIIHSQNSASEMRIINEAIAMFGDAMFDTIIKSRERIKSWMDNGITDDPNDRWDREALAQFEELAHELLERIQLMEVTEHA